MAESLSDHLQQYAAAAGCTYQGEGMGLYHFMELSTRSNFCLRVPPAHSRECITPDKVLARAREVRQLHGKPEPVTEAMVGNMDAPIAVLDDLPGDDDEPTGIIIGEEDMEDMRRIHAGETIDPNNQEWLRECGMVDDHGLTDRGLRMLSDGGGQT